MGRQKNREPRVAVRVSVSKTCYSILEALLEEGVYGVTVPEVAMRVLERSLQAERYVLQEWKLKRAGSGE